MKTGSRCASKNGFSLEFKTLRPFFFLWVEEGGLVFFTGCFNRREMHHHFPLQLGGGGPGAEAAAGASSAFFLDGLNRPRLHVLAPTSELQSPPPPPSRRNPLRNGSPRWPRPTRSIKGALLRLSAQIITPDVKPKLAESSRTPPPLPRRSPLQLHIRVHLCRAQPGLSAANHYKDDRWCLFSDDGTQPPA